MKACELSLPQDFVTEFSATLHDCSQHLVITSPREEDLPGVELEERTTD